MKRMTTIPCASHDLVCLEPRVTMAFDGKSRRTKVTGLLDDPGRRSSFLSKRSRGLMKKVRNNNPDK